jgi:acetoin utilization deacetylase AcuC-like enzyme
MPAMQIFANPEQQLHDPPFEILEGQVKPYHEAPRRSEMIAAALAAAGFAAPLAPRRFGLGPVLAVHDAAYVDYLGRAYVEWLAAGKPGAAVMPSTFPRGGFDGPSASPDAQAGRYIFDTSAPIVAGTYAAACGSADTALSGAAALLEGGRAAYALCRPPGHHAARALAGGYCFLNNAAIAAAHLAGATGGASEAGREPWGMRPSTVAVLDIDFHHGNGTQAIFYERSDVFFCSIHAHPDREYPYFNGFAEERGAGAGEGYNLNLPLAAGVDDAGYLAALDQALETIAAYSPRFLVISAGLDTFDGDPLGDFKLSTAGFAAIGAQIARLDLPTLFVQEGGYAVEQLGANVVALLGGFSAG